MIRENLNPTVEIRGILPTMYDGRTLHSKEAVEMLKENFGDLVFETRIRKTVRYAEAPVQGSSVLKYDPAGSRRRGVPRPREGGARWRDAAPACVRARSPSSSGRPRPHSASPRRRASPARRPPRSPRPTRTRPSSRQSPSRPRRARRAGARGGDPRGGRPRRRCRRPPSSRLRPTSAPSEPSAPETASRPERPYADRRAPTARPPSRCAA